MNGADLAVGDPLASLRRFWWVILGVLIIVYPGKTLTVISVAFGVFILSAVLDLLGGIIVITYPGIGWSRWRWWSP